MNNNNNNNKAVECDILDDIECIERRDIKTITGKELLDKVQITYDSVKDLIIVNTDSSLIIKCNNVVIASNTDIVMLSGDAVGAKGNIQLNPTGFKGLFKKMLNLLN